MKKIEATILGQSYILGCPEGGETALLAAVASVDREMSSIRDGGKVKARERIAVLAALNLAFQLAERAEQRPVAAAPTQGSDAARAASDDDAAAKVDLAGLIRRLDIALGADGQLI